jgi:hypothetical protein
MEKTRVKSQENKVKIKSEKTKSKDKQSSQNKTKNLKNKTKKSSKEKRQKLKEEKEKNEKKYEILTMKDVINIVLQNDLTYPGLHQGSCERTKISLPLLQESSQLILIWKQFCFYIEKKLTEGISVNVKNFGTFFFTNINNIKTKTNLLFTETFTDNSKLNIKKLTFQLSSNYRKILNNFPDEMKKRKILQPIWNMENRNIIDWNPFPISKACFLKDDVIKDGIDNIFKAIYDIVKAKKNLIVQTGFCNIYFLNGEMKYSFEENTLLNNIF